MILHSENVKPMMYHSEYKVNIRRTLNVFDRYPYTRKLTIKSTFGER